MAAKPLIEQQRAELRDAVVRSRLGIPRAPLDGDIFELAGWMTEAVVAAQGVVADLDDTDLSMDLERVRQAVLRLGQRVAKRRKAFT